MHPISLLNIWLKSNRVFAHQYRLNAVVRIVDALLSGGRLSLTHLGRHRPGHAYTKHHIKAVDRLLGNKNLHAERVNAYATLARRLLLNVPQPLIIVDWADCELQRQALIIRASIPLGGRAYTLYEEVHPLRRYNNPKTHRRFLEQLHRIVPEHVTPIVVTDAGFRGPWFRAVEALGWDWIGRIRNTIKFYNPETGRWCFAHSLYAQATPRVQHIGERCLSKRHRYQCRLYLVRAYQKRPGRPRKRKWYGTNDNLYRKLHRAPWLLATSLPHTKAAGNRIMRAYARRMQIEEAFRDLKNHRWGYALRYARSNNTARLEILLLIAFLATLVLWLLGIAAREKGLQRHFQANTEMKRSVLSIPFLGQALYRSTRFKLSPEALRLAFKELIALGKTQGALA